MLKWRYPHGLPGTPAASATFTPVPAGEVAGSNPPASAFGSSSAPGTAGSSSGATLTAASGRYIEIDTDTYTAELTTVGARLASYKLKRYRETSATNSPPYQMVLGGDRLPLGLLVDQGAATVSDGSVAYTTTALVTRRRYPEAQDAAVTFDGQTL